jgi:hypothetical protein
MNELFEPIESDAFDLDYSAISGLQILMLGLADDGRVQALITAMSRSANVQTQVYQRFLALLQNAFQPGHRHRYDFALSAYLYALHQTAPDLAPTAAAHAVRVPEAWWTGRVARALAESDAAPVLERQP